MLLAVLNGSGVQIFFMMFITLGKISIGVVEFWVDLGYIMSFYTSIYTYNKWELSIMELKCKSINNTRFCSDCEICFVVFACLGFLSPANRGALMTCTLVLYVCLGTPAGYVSARVYKSKARQVSSAETMFPLDKEKTIVCWKLTRIHRFHVAFDELHLIHYILWGFQYLVF